MEYQADRFETLRRFLEGVVVRAVDEGKVRIALDQARPYLVALLDQKSKNPAEEAELRRGRVTVNGGTVTIKQEDVQEALHLSSQLNLSENQSACLLIQSKRIKSQHMRSDADTSAILYYQERAHLLRSLQLIFQDFSVTDVDPGVQEVIEHFRRELVAVDVKTGTGAAARGKWVDKLIKELERSKEAAAALKGQLTASTAVVAAPPAFNRTALFGQPGPVAGPSTQGNGATVVARFSDEVVQYMLEQTQRERRDLGQIIHAVARCRLLGKPQITSLVGALTNAQPNDTVVVHLLMAVLGAWTVDGDPADGNHSRYLAGLQQDSGFLVSMSNLLQSKWKIKQVKAVALLQWAIFLEAAYEQDPDLESQTQIWQDQIEGMIFEAIANDAFPFLAYDVLAFKQTQGFSIAIGSYHRVLAPPRSEEASRTATRDEQLGLEEEFWNAVTDQVERFIGDFIASQQSVLRRLRHRQEDTMSALQLAVYRPNVSPDRRDAGPTDVRRDVDYLFAIIAALYRDRPDAGLLYWGDGQAEDGNVMDDIPGTMCRLASSKVGYFLRWAAECRITEMVPSVYDMLTSLATGREASTKAYQFFQTASGENDLSPSPCSWVHLFRALRHYVVHLGQNDGQGVEIHPEEARHLRAYVRLLRQVVRHSPTARLTLYNHQRYKPLQTIFSLVSQPIALDLKADLLSTIAAFASSGDGSGAEIAQKCWLLLEQSQILSTVSATGSGLSGPLARTGILQELEEVEVPNRLYPQSMAFVALLAALVHPARQSSPLRAGAELDLQSIPDNLGASYRAPGLDPYIRFVVEEMLQKAASRDYQQPSDAFRVVEISLAFVERCLTGYDLGPVLASGAVGDHRQQGVISAIQRTMAHPGFDIMLRILSNTALTRSLLEILIAGPQHLEGCVSSSDPISRCILRALRIFTRVFELQGPFLEVVLPMILEHGSNSLLLHHADMAREAEPLDQHMFHANAAVVSTAILVGNPLDDEAALLSVKLISIIAQSPSFDAKDAVNSNKRSGRMNRLLGLIESSYDRDVIISVFRDRLAAAKDAFAPPEDDDVFEQDAVEDLSSRDMSRHAAATRSAILDLLLQNTQPSRPAPNIAHLLLGIDVKATPDRLVIENKGSPKATLSCLYVILELLDPADPDDDNPAEASVDTLLVRDTVLAEKCYRLIRQLCLHDFSAAAMSRFLRTSHKYFIRQAQTLPLDIPEYEAGADGKLIYPADEERATACGAAVASLHATAWLIETIALELNTLTIEALRAQTGELVTVLFDNAQPMSLSVLDMRGRPEQDLPCVQAILARLSCEWRDAVDPGPINLNFFNGVDWNQCLQRDSAGCELYDTAAILALLGAARRDAQSRGLLSNVAQQEEMKNEVRSILQALVVENHRRQIAFAKLHALTAWRTLLELLLNRAFHLLSTETRHNFILDLLATSLADLGAQQMDDSSSQLYSGIVVSLMSKLRYEAQHFSGTGGGIAVVFPKDRLLATLDSLLRSIDRATGSNVVRGNLYSALLNFLHYVLAARQGLGDEKEQDDNKSPTPSKNRLMATRPNDELELGTHARLANVYDRLLPQICRDAAMGLEVWRTVAFALLDSLLNISSRLRFGAKFLATLEKDGSLKRFVDTLKESETAVLNTLEPDPASLNPLYVFESQVSFLTRIASTRFGAEKLLGYQLVERFAACEYLRPVYRDHSTMMELDGFLPSVAERHHQLLLPSLQLVVSLLTSIGLETATASAKALLFATAQREALVAVLRNVSLSSAVAVQEIQLMTLVMRVAFPAVPDDELISSTGFGALHMSQLAIAARVCGGQGWMRGHLPSSESENRLASVIASESPASVPSPERALALQASLLAYLRVVSSRTSGSAFHSVLLPTMKHLESSVGLLGIGPTFGSTFTLLRESTDALAVTLLESSDIAAQAKDWQRWTGSDVNEIIRLHGNSGDELADPRSAARRAIARAHGRLTSRALTLLDIIETALLLLWRNADHFLATAPSTTRSTSRTGQIDASLKDDCLLALRPIVARLQGLSLTQADLTPAEAEDRQKYLQSLVRNLSDIFATPDQS